MFYFFIYLLRVIFYIILSNLFRLICIFIKIVILQHWASSNDHQLNLYNNWNGGLAESMAHVDAYYNASEANTAKAKVGPLHPWHLVARVWAAGWNSGTSPCA